MSSPKDQALVTFHDVAACFSAEEWGLLEDWQKEMYENVMREIHAALLAMGFEIMNPDVLLRINGAKDVCAGICDSGGPVRGSARRAVDPDRLINVKQEPGSGANACRRRGSRAQAPAASSPDILLRIKREERLSLSEVSESSSCHSPGEPVITSVFSLQTERTKDVGGMHHGNRPKAQATQLQKQFASQRIKQEQPDYATASAGDSVPGALRDDDPTVKPINADKTRLNQPPEEREAQERTIQDDGTDYTSNGSIYKWSSERPYRCHECAKTFSDPARFLRHRIGHTGGRPYRCRHCVKTFRQPYELMVHQRVHTGEKPYHCTVCGKKFIKNSILKVHQRIHTGERPYKCPQCSRSFVQSHHLKSHQKTHTADRLQSRHETSPALRKPVG